MTGNCIGWVAYSFLTNDIFLLIGNGPGLLLSFWLNYSAVKLEYIEVLVKESLSNNTKDAAEQNPIQSIHDDESQVKKSDHIHNDDSINEKNKQLNGNDDIIMGKHPLFSVGPHEKKSLYVCTFWLMLLSSCKFVPLLLSTVSDSTSQQQDISSKIKFTIGLTTNINAIFFYASPLSTILTVIRNKNSSSIHRMTLFSYLLNSLFWTVYGAAILDVWIAIPNGIGLVLSLVQLCLSLIFRRNSGDDGRKSLKRTFIIRDDISL